MQMSSSLWAVETIFLLTAEGARREQKCVSKNNKFVVLSSIN